MAVAPLRDSHQNCPLAILCAVVLPGIDGLTLYRRVVDLRPEVVSRFVLMSGRTEHVRRFAEATGATFLAKPFQVRELCEQHQKNGV